MADTYFQALLGALPKDIRKSLEADPRDVEDFEAAVARIRKTHPSVQMAAAAFAEHLMRHDDEGVGWKAWSRLRLTDLYVAFACGRGHEEALAWVETNVFSQLGAGLGIGLNDDEVDEVRQHVRQKLLVSDGDDEPRILTYGGRASLFQWVRVIARRAAIDRFRKADTASSSLEETQPIASGAGEKDIVSALARPDFRDAILEASAGLPKRDREILHLSFAQGASIDEIGEKFGVHRSTAARWIEKAKEALLEATRTQLEEKLKLNPFEIDELIELVGNQIDVTITTLLKLKTGTKNLDLKKD